MDEFNKWLQSRLTSHGFPCGVIDGVLGDLTFKALRAFQASRGLEPNGKADTPTIAALRATSVGTVRRPEGPAANPVLPGKSPWPTQAQVPTFYGAPGAALTTIELPYDMWLAWDTGTRLRKMTLHPKVAAGALWVYEQTAVTYSAKERTALGLDKFGGSFNIRKMRGGTKLSMHAYAIAIDHDPERNGLNTHAPQARLSHDDAVPFWKLWEAEGWLSLGRARNYDWMHVQAARL